MKSNNGATYENEFKEKYDNNIKSIKDYLTQMKKVKASIRANETKENTKMVDEHQSELQEERQRKKETSEFLIIDVGRIMDL